MASIRKLPSGHYRVRWRDLSDMEHGITLPTKKAALEEKARVEVATARGEVVDRRLAKTSFGDYLESIMAYGLDLRPSTRALYETEARRYILPRFGGVAVGAIQPVDLRRFYGDLQKQGVGIPTIEVVHRLISRVMAHAVHDGILQLNPASRVKAPRAERKPVRVLSLKEIITIAMAAENPTMGSADSREAQTANWRAEFANDYRLEPHQRNDLNRLRIYLHDRMGLGGEGTMILVAFFGGLRFGEVAALRPSRVRFNPLRIEVMESATEVAGEVQIGPTKTTGSRRTVPLPSEPVVAEIVRKHLDEVLAYKVREAKGAADRHGRYAFSDDLVSEDPLLFSTKYGHPWPRTRFTKRVWNPAVELAGITPPPNFHDLRHSYAAWLIENGEHVKTIQDRLGHTSVRTSLDLYGHLMKSLDTTQVDRMNAALRVNGGT